MKKNLYILGLLVGLSSVGCSRIASESVHTASGASGRAMAIQEVTVDLADYDGFIVEPFTDGMGGMGNKAFLAEVQQKVANRIIEKTYLTREGEKVLRISGELIQYDEGSTTDKFVSPMQEAVCRVKLSDDSSGKVLGTTNCTSRAKSSFRKGPEELAEGMGKAIADEWIVKHDSRGVRPEEKE